MSAQGLGDNGREINRYACAEVWRIMMSGVADSRCIHKSEWWALKVQERMEEKSMARHVPKGWQLGTRTRNWLTIRPQWDIGWSPDSWEDVSLSRHTDATFGINQCSDKEPLNKLNFPVYRLQMLIPTSNIDHLLLLYLSIFKFLYSESITTCLIFLSSCVLLIII